jgi:hypothetical protein
VSETKRRRRTRFLARKKAAQLGREREIGDDNASTVSHDDEQSKSAVRYSGSNAYDRTDGDSGDDSREGGRPQPDTKQRTSSIQKS